MNIYGMQNRHYRVCPNYKCRHSGAHTEHNNRRSVQPTYLLKLIIIEMHEYARQTRTDIPFHFSPYKPQITQKIKSFEHTKGNILIYALE